MSVLLLAHRMRSLELAGTAGVGVIAVIAAIMVWDAIRSGLPAIANGELPLWGLKVGWQQHSSNHALARMHWMPSQWGLWQICNTPLHLSSRFCRWAPASIVQWTPETA